MTKFLLFLSMAALIGAAIVAGLNNRKLGENRLKITELTQQLTTVNSDLDQSQQALTAAKDANKQAKTANQQAKANLELAADDLRRKTAESEKLAGQYEAKKNELAEFAVIEDKLKGRSVDQIKVEIERLNQDKASLQKERDDLESQVVKVQDIYDKNVKKLEDLDGREQKRREQLALTGVEADVIAINREFGFVILNAGSDQGVSPDSGLLVQRGVDRIGRLRIVSVEPQITVADIVPGSVNPGVQLMVKDKVIFESR
jgi:hypothetical protein